MFGFCKPISSKKRFLPFRVLNETYSFTLYEKAGQLAGQDWDKFASRKGPFLNRTYLHIIESSLYAKLQCRYVIVYKHGKACGIIYYQVIDFNAGAFSSLLAEKSLSRHKAILKKYVDAHQTTVLMRLFTCGNNLISGDHGFCFDTSIPSVDANALLIEITELLAKEDKLKNTLCAILLKDFESPLEPAHLFKEENYLNCLVEANMKVSIPPNLGSIDEYIQLFSKKYRNRAKSVFKRLGPVQIKELSTTEVIQLDAKIYALYEAIFQEAKFKLLKLPLHYFSQTKALFESKYVMKGLYLEGELVAFYSYFINEQACIEAHYIGLNYEFNQTYCLYQNILYDLIAVSIQHRANTLNLGRTAAEIKTTVGALPQDLICYIKAQNTLSKYIQKPLINLLQPAEYVPRNPFKEEG